MNKATVTVAFKWCKHEVEAFFLLELEGLSV